MAEKEHKRKRASEGAGRPKKKAATATTAAHTPHSDIRVSFPDVKEGLHPVLGILYISLISHCHHWLTSVASTPGLNFPFVPFDAYSKPIAGSESSKPPTPNTHALVFHSSEHPKLDFTASADSDAHLNHYIGVYDPSTSSMEVLPAHSVTLRSTLRSEIAEVHAQNAARSFTQQRLELGMEFGTKKAKKAINSRTVNAISKETGRGVEAAVLDSVKEASDALPAQKELQDSVLAAKPIPRPNLDATKVEDVYPLSVLVPPSEMRNLAVKEWQDAGRANENVKLTSRFVASRLQPLAARDDVEMLKALKYLYLLLEFNAALKVGGRSGGKKIPLKDQMKVKMEAWPDALVDGVRRRFADGRYMHSSRDQKFGADTFFSELNKWHVDKLMTHMAALSLYIDNWRTDIHDLKEDLRLDNKQ